jgi:thioredoxin 1
MSKSTITVGGANWEKEVMQSGQPVLVDFWAPWCAPCRMIAPALDELAQEYAGRVKVAKLNVDQDSEIAGQFGVQSIPTLILFQGGRPVDQFVGARPKAELARLLAEYAERAPQAS